MVVLYGAGKEFQRIAKESNGTKACKKDNIIVVDTYPEKYPEGVLGFEINGPEIIQGLSSEDCVCITSKQYYKEIADSVKIINPYVDIYDYKSAEWIIYKKTKIDEYVRLEENYTVKEDLSLWLDSILSDELRYWKKRIPEQKGKNDIRFLEREFAYSYNEEIVFTEQDKILDVGCGPLPKFGNILNGVKINYMPVDPLAYQYKNLLKENKVVLPVEPSFALMEVLTCFYEENSIDYVIVNNALDHCINIIRAFIECFNVVKVGGNLLLEHVEAEGLHNDYAGLHKWNITCTDDALIFFNNRGTKINISKMFSPYANIEVKRMKYDYRDLIIAKIKKKSCLPQTIINQYDDRMLIGKMLDKLFEKLIKA